MHPHLLCQFLCWKLINIHKSRAVSLYLRKHRIQIRMRFIDMKSLHVMYYRPFDRLMGSWIINEFLKRWLKPTIYQLISNARSWNNCQLYHARETATIKLSCGCSCKTKSARSSNISWLFLTTPLFQSCCFGYEIIVTDEARYLSSYIQRALVE